MPRSVQLVVPVGTTDALSSELLDEEGVLSLQVTRGVSVKPPGDVISIDVLDRSVPSVMAILVAHGVGRDASTSLTTDMPLSIVSPTSTPAALRDTNESSLEEMEQILGREAPRTSAVLSLMAVSGVLATVGIAEGALHLVIAAMIIAPGFVPIVRVVFSGIVRRDDIARGVADTALAYGALLIGAGVAAVALSLVGHSAAGEEPSYAPPLVSVGYWSTVTLEAAAVTFTAGVAGGLLIATNRALLTAGVMVALALVPAAALVPIGVVVADWALVAKAAARWLVDVALLAFAAGAVLMIKQRTVHRGRSLS